MNKERLLKLADAIERSGIDGYLDIESNIHSCGHRLNFNMSDWSKSEVTVEDEELDSDREADFRDNCYQEWLADNESVIEGMSQEDIDEAFISDYRNFERIPNDCYIRHTSCNTIACIAGYAIALFNNGAFDDDGDLECPFDDAASLLEISEDDATELFLGKSYFDSAPEFHRITEFQAGRCIRNFAREGVVDWRYANLGIRPGE